MFSSTAFPRIPLFGGKEPPATAALSDDDPGTTPDLEKPPAVPFDSLVLAADAAPDHAETNRRNAASVTLYEDVVASVDCEDAREFLAALVFLGTRSTLPATASAED